MRIALKTGLFVFLAAILLAACSPAEHKELGAPRNIMASLTGTWKLIKATQVDEPSAAKGFPFKEMDITTLFPYTDFRLTFNSGSPGTFTTTAGGSPKIIKLTSGSWAVDNPEYPQKITLTSGSTTEVITLGAYPVGAMTTLKLKVQRYEAVTPPAIAKLLITYTYEFAKQ
jgi:hypothetical protein